MAGQTVRAGSFDSMFSVECLSCIALATRDSMFLFSLFSLYFHPLAISPSHRTRTAGGLVSAPDGRGRKSRPRRNNVQAGGSTIEPPPLQKFAAARQDRLDSTKANSGQCRFPRRLV
jgi:hypothetical protein